MANYTVIVEIKENDSWEWFNNESQTGGATKFGDPAYLQNVIAV